MMTEWNGSIFTSLTALTNSERLALWVLKRGDTPLFFKAFKKPVKPMLERPLSEPRHRPLANGLIKDTLTGEVLEPTRHISEVF